MPWSSWSSPSYCYENRPYVHVFNRPNNIFHIGQSIDQYVYMQRENPLLTPPSATGDTGFPIICKVIRYRVWGPRWEGGIITSNQQMFRHLCYTHSAYMQMNKQDHVWSKIKASACLLAALSWIEVFRCCKSTAGWDWRQAGTHLSAGTCPSAAAAWPWRRPRWAFLRSAGRSGTAAAPLAPPHSATKEHEKEPLTLMILYGTLIVVWPLLS